MPKSSLQYVPAAQAEFKDLMGEGRVSSSDLPELTDGKLSQRTVDRALNQGLMSLLTEKILRRVLNEIVGGYSSPDDRKVLRAFRRDFADHPLRVTSVRPLIPFDAEPEWDPKERMWSVSHRELNLLWRNELFYKIYEAVQVRFVERRGDLRRVFLVGGERNEEHRFEKRKVIARHVALGLPTKCFARVRWGEIVKALNVICHMFICIGDVKTAFFQYRTDTDPMIVDTIDRAVAQESLNVYADLWSKSEPAEDWLKVRPLDDETMNGVEHEAEYIRAIASGKDPLPKKGAGDPKTADTRRRKATRGGSARLSRRGPA